MKMRWFVVEVSISSSENCIITGNCATEALAKTVVDALEAQSDRIFRIVGPITQNMMDGKLDPEDIKLVEAQMEHLEHQQSGGLTH